MAKLVIIHSEMCKTQYSDLSYLLLHKHMSALCYYYQRKDQGKASTSTARLFI
jgi:hypothetical protein